MQKDIWLSSTNRMTFGSELRMSNICQVDLQQLGENKVLFRIWVYGYNLSHFVPTFCPTQGCPLRFLALSRHKSTTLGMVPPRSHANASFYMLLILQLRPPLCIISPQHQSLIKPNINKNTMPTMMYLLAQWKSKQQLFTSASF